MKKAEEKELFPYEVSSQFGEWSNLIYEQSIWKTNPQEENQL